MPHAAEREAVWLNEAFHTFRSAREGLVKAEFYFDHWFTDFNLSPAQT